MKFSTLTLSTTSALLLAACATDDVWVDDGIPATPIAASFETAPMVGFGDRADDPALWANPTNISNSLILGTNKDEGLHVYDLSGAETQFLDVGAVNNVDKMIQVGPEAAVVFGPFSLQGEYHWTTVERTAGLGDADLEGGYVFASWFVTGESRPYNAKKGTFGRVKAENAIELAARYSTVDLSEASAAATNGEEDNYTLGANYYFNPNVRAIVNYVYADVDHPTGATADEEAHSLGARLAVDF